MQFKKICLFLILTANSSAAFAATGSGGKGRCSNDMHRIYETEFRILDEKLGKLNQKLWDLGCTNPARSAPQGCSGLLARDYPAVSGDQQKAYTRYVNCRASRQ